MKFDAMTMQLVRAINSGNKSNMERAVGTATFMFDELAKEDNRHELAVANATLSERAADAREGADILLSV